MTLLDQNRAVGQLAGHLGCTAADIQDVVIWGNHGPTMYADVSLATAQGEKVVGRADEAWLSDAFLSTVATRGKAIINARGASSAASAASAAIDHMRDWFFGTGDRIVSMAIPSQGWYGVPEGLVFSFPVRVRDGVVEVVEGLELDEVTQANIRKNVEALEAEKAAVAELL
jgi:malate dehydrogenase